MNDIGEKEVKQSFVFDTYAILEVIKGNESYKSYLNSNIVINDFIFAELCYNLSREDKSKAEEYAKIYAPYISNLEPNWIKKAMEFRLKWKDRNVSMADCISYFQAKELGIKFLTGDKEFEDLENVEFVK